MIRPIVRKEVKRLLGLYFPDQRLLYLDHHLAHAWSSLAFSEMPQAGSIIVTLDGEGDGLCGSINTYNGGEINREISFAAGTGIGTLYGKVTEFLGMRRNEHEFKIMGLAPYAKISDGERVLSFFRELIHFDRENIQFMPAFHMQYAKYYFVMKDLLRERFDSIAYGIQRFTEELVLDLTKTVANRYRPKSLYFGGGVFMNIKLNQKIIGSRVAERYYFTPSCGDESLAIGAAKYAYDSISGEYSRSITSLYLGSEYSDDEIKRELTSLDNGNYRIELFTPGSSFSIEERVAELLAANNLVARFKGRMEWGARALGNRSILANPADKDAVKRINTAIKNRDFWMPFAPTILIEKANEYLHDAIDSPYMAIGFDTKESYRDKLQACVHPYDYSCRPQLLHREQNPEYYALIKKFESKTGIGAILNTSFNLHGYPIVENPVDAISVLKQSGLKYLAIGNYLITKRDFSESQGL